LNGSANRDHLVRVDAFIGVLSIGQLAHQLLHHRHAGSPAYQHNLVNFADAEVGVFNHRVKGQLTALQQLFGHLFKLCSRELQQQVFRAGGIRGDIGQVDFRLHHAAKLNLGFFRGFTQALECLAVTAQVNALFALEFVCRPMDNHLIPIVAAQVGIAVRGFYFHHAAAHFQQADVEGAAAQVKHQDDFVFFFIQSVGQSRSSGLIDDAQHLKPRDFARVFGRLALAVIKICRYGDDRLGYFLTQIGFRVAFQLTQDHR